MQPDVPGTLAESAREDARAAVPGRRRPWWAYLFFYARAPDDLPATDWRLLGVLGLTFLINQYDMAILGLALPQIQAGLGVGEAEIGRVLAVVKLGVVPVVLVAVVADRWGRRRMLLVTIVGFTVSTAATALARDAREFAALQFCARFFIGAEEMLAIVVVTEELSARARGWGLGILATFGALGHGLAALVFGFVEALPFGWRALYLIGVVPLLLLAWIRRSVPETRRFAAQRAAMHGETHAIRGLVGPLRAALRMYPGRFVALSAAVLPFSFAMFTALAFVSKSLQDVHGYTPADVTMLYLGGGFLAIAGYGASGSLADRFGRKPVLSLAVLINTAGLAFFYNAGDPLVVVAWIVALFSFMAADMLFGALGSELFPTSYRSTASGLRGLVMTLGGALGLWVEGWLWQWTGSHALAITCMLAAAPLASLVILLFLPETGRRELEEIAPEAA